jgi:FkbM family methyltransferase
VDRLLTQASDGPWIERIGPVDYELDTRDLIDFHTCYLGGHDARVIRLLRDHLGRCASPVLWDIGANVGTITLPLLAEVHDLRAYAFEPSPGVLRRFRRNIQLNPSLEQRLTVQQTAVSDTPGSVDFFASSDPGNSGMGSLGSSPETVGSPLTVSCVTGDDLVSDGSAEMPNAIKIDVEGFELQVLRGMRSTLAGAKDLLVVFEHEPVRLSQRGTPPGACVDMLQSLGLAVRCLLDGELVPICGQLLESHQDLVAARL